MQQCEFCGKELSDHATFCGQCGRAPTYATEALTGANVFPPADLRLWNIPTATSIPIPISPTQAEQYQDRNAVTDISRPMSPILSPTFQERQAGFGQLGPAREDEEDQEEKRRQAAILGLGIVALGSSVPQTPGIVPMVQGTPQMTGVPMVQGTPPTAQATNWQLQPQTPQPTPTPHMLHTLPNSGPLHHGHHPGHPHHPLQKPIPKSNGCVPALIVAAVTVVLIVGGIIGAGLTIFSPVLSLSGSTNVLWGQSIQLHGSNFIPGSSVALTLDGAEPLYYASRGSATNTRATQGSPPHISTTPAPTEVFTYQNGGFSWATAEQISQASISKNIVVAGGDGTFTVMVNVSPSWHPGHHSIRAAEQISPRSAVLDLFVHSAAGTPTATPTATETPTVQPTPTTPAAGLSCVNPAAVALTANQGSNQLVSQQVTLCTNGSGPLNWTASWNQNQASWLRLDHSSGQIQAPGKGQVNISALAGGLKPGNYATTVTFSSQVGGSKVTLNVNFAIQAWCIKVTPGSLQFTGATGNWNPQTQTMTLQNCGGTGNWSANFSSNASASWLKFSPKSGIVNSGATQKVTVTVTQGNFGTYTGKLIFTLGSSQSTVNVSLNVQAPTLQTNTTSINVGNDCKLMRTNTGAFWQCFVTVTNLGNVQGTLDWSASSTAANITFTPANGTLNPGQSVQVEVDIPYSNCQTGTILTFSGPANSVSVSVSCYRPSS